MVKMTLLSCKTTAESNMLREITAASHLPRTGTVAGDLPCYLPLILSYRRRFCGALGALQDTCRLLNSYRTVMSFLSFLQKKN